MSIRDLIRPLKTHTLGIPMAVQPGLRHMADVKARIIQLSSKLSKTSQESSELGSLQQMLGKQLSIATETYSGLIDKIEYMLNHDVDVEHEQQAADIVTRLVIDAAFLHMCIAGADESIGKFPYDDLANKIFPVSDKPDPETVCKS